MSFDRSYMCTVYLFEKIQNHLPISVAAHLLGLLVRIPPGPWISLSCECCVLSGRGLCDLTDHSSRGVLPSVMCLIRCINNPLHVQRIGKKRPY